MKDMGKANPTSALRCNKFFSELFSTFKRRIVEEATNVVAGQKPM